MRLNQIRLIPTWHLEDSDSFQAVSCVQMDIMSEGRKVGKIIINQLPKSIEGDLIGLDGALSESEIALLWQKAVCKVIQNKEPDEPLATRFDLYDVGYLTSPRRYQRVLRLRDLLMEAGWNKTPVERSEIPHSGAEPASVEAASSHGVMPFSYSI